MSSEGCCFGAREAYFLASYCKLGRFLDPFKIIGGALVALGFIFRAISLAYFKQRAKLLPDTPKALRQFEGRKQRALMIDALFIVMGFYLLLTH